MTSVALKNFPFSLVQDIIPHARKYDMKLFVLSRSRCSSWLYCSYSFSKSSLLNCPYRHLWDLKTMIIVSFPGNAIKPEPAFLYQHNVRFCYVKHIIDYLQQSLAYNRLGKLQLYTYMRPKKKIDISSSQIKSNFYKRYQEECAKYSALQLSRIPLCPL